MKLFSFLWACLLLGLFSISQAKERPHIVLVMADDHGYGDISLHGGPHLHTPHIDRIARDGAILATNTSTLDVDAIAAVTGRPADVASRSPARSRAAGRS